jgi:hypothetical protein
MIITRTFLGGECFFEVAHQDIVGVARAGSQSSFQTGASSPLKPLDPGEELPQVAQIGLRVSLQGPR